MPIRVSDIIRDAPGNPNHPWHEALRMLIDYVKEQALKELREELIAEIRKPESRAELHERQKSN